jgi:hypothetical protein
MEEEIQQHQHDAGYAEQPGDEVLAHQKLRG